MINNEYFIFNNQLFYYITNTLNTNGNKTERVVELPIMKYYIDQYYNKNIIEIGCVSPYYYDTNHIIYDISDPHAKCTKTNARNIDVANQNILSISTIEHFDILDYKVTQKDTLDPYEFILKIVQTSESYCLTFPLGYNISLDSKILNSSIDSNFLCRIADSNTWIQKEKKDLTSTDLLYDFTFQRCANSIAVIQNFI